MTERLNNNLNRRVGEGNGTPLQYSCLEKSHGQRSLIGYSPWGREESDRTEQLHFHALQKEMATHSSVFAWRIPYHKAVRTLLVSSPSALALTHSEQGIPTSSQSPVHTSRAILLPQDYCTCYFHCFEIFNFIDISRTHSHFIQVSPKVISLMTFLRPLSSKITSLILPPFNFFLQHLPLT